MEYIERKSCVICDNDDLEPLYLFNDFPVFCGATQHPSIHDCMASMNWCISKKSGCIQLESLLPLEVLYPESHNPGEVGSVWLEHHQAFAAFIKKYSPQNILEIGGSHGILSREHYAITKKSTSWTILEPNPCPSKGVNARFIKTYFDDDFRFDQDYDTIVHSHVFEHLYQPKEILKTIHKKMKIGTKHIFSVPNMRAMLEQKATNTLNFEHTFFVDEPYVEGMLTETGFKILEKIYYSNHSIFYATKIVAKDISAATPKYDNLYHKNKKLFNNYISFHEDLIKSLNIEIAKYGRCYLFGAHYFSQYLLAFGLNSDGIICILDNAEHKQNKRLYGTNIMIASPKILAKDSQPVVILKAGLYNDEIKNDILANIQPKTIFI